MNKLTASLLATALVASISGCETSTQAYNMYQKGAAGFTCQEIDKGFAAYKRDRTSVEGLAVLVPLMTGDNSTTESSTSNGYFEKAKSAANLALLVQGCNPI